MTGRGKGGFGLGKPCGRPGAPAPADAAERDARVGAEQDEEREERDPRRGKYGILRSAECETCAGAGELRNGNLCDDCVCGACGQEKHYCGGCTFTGSDDSDDGSEDEGSEDGGSDDDGSDDDGSDDDDDDDDGVE
ncbi:hypothetical protein JKP88DRAFT_275819 [Tribonema minus]|uniref:Uncharacterized protein n=1 Tax=Tribonema minus TaxID=303371 RepID=A0A835Z6K1_9STRA|nr:hypothetical protein JKP88DRAFT_275819 [Tribonema minus]